MKTLSAAMHAAPLLLLLPTCLHAEEQLETIVVSAEKRATDLQTTPAALSVVSGQALADEQIHSILDIAGSLPNVQVGTVTGQADIAIRGIGFSTLNPGDEGRVAFYVDGIYIARPSNQLGAFFDIDRVEVLRGPQGTLYGRNATGGAFQLLTRNPTRELSGYLTVTGGNYGLVQTEGAISGPLSETLSGRVAFQTVNRNGYGKNLFSGKDVNDASTQAVRGKLLWEPTSALGVTFSAHYNHENDRNFGFLSFGPGVAGVPLYADSHGTPTLNFSQDIDTNTDTSNYRQSYGASLDAVYRLTDAIQLRALLGYEHSFYDLVQDGDGSTLFLLRSEQQENSNQTTAEFQLSGETTHAHWIAGLYYFHENDEPLNRAPINWVTVGLPDALTQGVALLATLKTNAGAAYGNLTYDVTDALSVTAGARYSVEDKKDIGDIFQLDFSTPWPPFLPPVPQPGFPLNQDKTFNSFTPKLTVDYKFAPGIFAYASFSKGYKSGGYNFGSLQHAFNPEKITSYELGLKSRLLDNRLTVNLAAFHYDYSNIQTQVVIQSPPSVSVTNAGRAKVDGFEADVVLRPLKAMQLDASLSLLDSRYTEFMTADTSRPDLGVLDLSGNRLSQAPPYTANLGAQYEWTFAAGRIMARGEYQRVGHTYFTPFNVDTADQPAYGMGNAFLRYTHSGGHFNATLFVRNISDAFVQNSAFLNATFLGNLVSGSAQPPRTYGVSVGYEF